MDNNLWVCLFIRVRRRFYPIDLELFSYCWQEHHQLKMGDVEVVLTYGYNSFIWPKSVVFSDIC